MDIVTPETAKRLKAAGFPQPELKAGQFWTAVRYPDGTARHDALLIIDHNNQLKPFDGGNDPGYRTKGNAVFLPTATDILSWGGMTMAKLTWINASDGMDFECLYDGDSFYDKNPAEACADAWLASHQKPA